MSEEQKRPDPVWMTSAMLKAYTHPLRRQMLQLFRQRGHLRAADIAEALGVAANSASFHLRVLADAQLIEEAPEHARDRRDRVWVARRQALSVGGPESPVPDEVLGGVMINALAEEHNEMLRRVLAWTPEYISGRTTETHAAFSQRSVRLTGAEFDALIERIDDVVSAAVEAHDPADPDSRPWQIDLLAADDRI
ncbi:helix-turn-helix domain-containing protein [Microbacterium sp. SSW1-49]|uniref:Helix-turn-helix domain-containing protein n=1 Tax=Microbacterium croceum TaxID=2851645 RepID=A0ABT0FBR1_9MICO|nr:winged helix-turn-helix domain-containing protein [Microbacterium croceum]MCK2035191.1 helix-turn-helix domain-containing protein [Microbacterium croceum]